jgi:hypothetical protein
MSDRTDNSRLFTPGASFGDVPEGDPARQAVASLRGYAYQVAVTALAWIDVSENDRIFLEVAEDYATVARDALRAVQVKDTAASGAATLNTPGIRDAVGSFVDLASRNPDRRVMLRYFTTSPIGTEHRVDDRPAGEAGLAYWRKAAGGADVAPLRTALLGETFSEAVRTFVSARDDDALRRDLLQNVHWDCGAPDLSMIGRELEERLVVVGRDRFHLPADEARRLADTLMNAVLLASIQAKAEERVLSRSMLYATIDAATRQSMPRASVDTLARLSSVLSGAMTGGGSGNTDFSLAELGWIVASGDLPVLANSVPRPDLEATIEAALQRRGVAIVFGGSGLGKSLVARAVAHARSASFECLDFRDLSAAETRQRLDFLFARIGAFTSSVMIFDDLNHLDDSGVTLALARVLSALRRRDRSAIFTCYRKPSGRSLVEMGLDASTLVEAPYFSENEVGEMVRRNGGDSATWGRVAYVVGAQGHPQLVHAFVLGAASRGWPTSELSEVIVRGLSSDETDAERDAARRRLAAALPEEARDLLYRLSLVIGRFDRALVLSIGSHSPAIARAGERLDELVGPWIEPIARDMYRVSPLAGQSGQGSLTTAEQRSIHALVARNMLSRGKIDASQASMILGHALVGKAEDCLSALAHSVMMADQETLVLLAEHFIALPILRTDVPIYPDNSMLSGMLRLAQFRLVAASSKDASVAACAAALLREVAAEPDIRLRERFEAVVLSTMLINMGSANYLPQWMALLRRFRSLFEKEKYLRNLKKTIESSPDSDGLTIYGMVFAIGASKISSIERFEQIIIDLDGLEPDERVMWLQAYHAPRGEFGVFVNGPWSAEHQRNAVEPADAERRYKRIAERTKNWGMRPLTIQCHVARVVILDEYADDKMAALRALDEGIAAVGDDIAFERERAKILWRDGDYANALEIMRRIADDVGKESPIERAFAMREAAISAAKTGDWAQAETWFAEGQQSAAQVETEDMQAMAIGLRADAAIAAFHVGAPERLLRGLETAISALNDLAPDATLRTAYCHRVIRHAVLWAKSRFEERDMKVDGQPVAMLPGTCSNPEPLPAIREQPLGPIDIAWYMLAEAEVDANVDIGICTSLRERFVKGPIPVCDVSLRGCLVAKDVRQLDAIGFAEHLMPFIEGMVFFSSQGNALTQAWDVLNPTRGEIPSLAEGGSEISLVELMATDAVLAFCASAVLLGKPDAIGLVEGALIAKLGKGCHGSTVFTYWRDGVATTLAELDKTVARSIALLRKGDHIEPRNIWGIGLRLYEKAGQSNFKRVLMPRIAAWLCGEWTRIVARESFRLARPTETVPAIEAALSHSGNDERFLARLLLEASDAVNVKLAAPYRNRLASVADEKASS